MLVLSGKFKTLDEAVKAVFRLRRLRTSKSYGNKSEIEFRLKTTQNLRHKESRSIVLRQTT